MIVARTVRTLVAVLLAGFGAGGVFTQSALAQSDDSGGWFDDSGQVDPQLPSEQSPSEQSPSGQLHIEGHPRGQYAAPPPDFQAPPAGTYSAPDPSEDEAAATAQSAESNSDGQQQALRDFSPRLAPYGSWLDDPAYGRVWVPSRAVVGVGFSPYVSGGRWELTADDSWYWASDYPFGAITFHYGRWVWLYGSGWAWAPGYVYAPAWVSFRVGPGGYIGWGPLAPYYVWRGGVFVSVGYRPPSPTRTARPRTHSRRR